MRMRKVAAFFLSCTSPFWTSFGRGSACILASAFVSGCNTKASGILAQRQQSVSSSALSSSSSQATASPAEPTKQTSEGQKFEDFVSFLHEKQIEIVGQLEELEAQHHGPGQAATFTRDPWGSDTFNASGSGGGGITRVISNGSVVEKGACSLTVVRGGRLSAERAAALSGRTDRSIAEGSVYSAAALSMVLHSSSPWVPTFRSDVRLFWVEGEELWLGGGADLTPFYLLDDDVRDFHSFYYRTVCDGNRQQYDQMKKTCDEYFYLPARGEHRGTGGVFFDDLPVSTDSMAMAHRLVETWMPSWIPIVQRRQSQPFSEKQRHWQLLRRGRYIEFNLLYDRGVKFGLSKNMPPGRMDSIMVSAPPLVAWDYQYPLTEEEERVMQVLKQPREWV